MIETVDIPLQGSIEPFIVQGDTIPKIEIESGDFPDLTTALEIKFQLYFCGKRVFDVSAGSGITVISATEMEIDQVEKENNLFPEGKSIGDLQITDANGERKTYFRLRYNIERQYTK